LESSWRLNVWLWGWTGGDALLIARYATGPLAVNHALVLWTDGLPHRFYLNPLTGLGADNGHTVVPDPGGHFPFGVAVLPD